MSPSASTMTKTAADNTGDSRSTPTPIVIREYVARDLPQLMELLEQGIRHYPEYTDDAGLPAHLEQCLNTDMGHIQDTYMAAGGNFWVGVPQDNADLVVGMIGLEPKPDSTAEVRRLSVRDGYKRQGIARQLVTVLEKWAQEHGFRKVFLGTGGAMTKARALYAATGYTQTGTYVIQEEPYFEGITFEKCLANREL